MTPPVSPKLAALVGLAGLAAVMVGVARITGGNGAKPHPLGTEVLVGHTDYSEGQSGVWTRIGLSVLAVRTGTREDLEAIGHEDKDVTPYYIDARFVNKGPKRAAPSSSSRRAWASPGSSS
jgi:hypothetical protein